jgi:nitrite reductase/ring-hydroxylating ferredoxin subunit
MSEHDPRQRTTAPDGRPESEQPLWRQDFPIDWPQDRYVARRDFTRFLGLTSLAFVVGQFWIGILSWFRGRQEKPAEQRIAAVAEVPVGGVRAFQYPAAGDACLLLRTGETTWMAYNQKCTHLSCAVVPDVARAQLRCPCHHGCFDLQTGRPLAGPPRRPLPRILLEIRDSVVYATGVEERTV